MGQGRGRSGRPWERIKARIQAETTNCWRCGKELDGTTHKWPHPLSVTVGHIIALEDCEEADIDPEDETNLAGECISCNMRDGAQRSNHNQHGTPAAGRVSYKNARW